MPNTTEQNRDGEARKLPRGLTIRDGVTYFNDIPVRDMIALPVHVAAILVGRTRWTLWRAIPSGKLKPQGRTTRRSDIDW